MNRVTRGSAPRQVVPVGRLLWRVHHHRQSADRLRPLVALSDRPATALAERLLPAAESRAGGREVRGEHLADLALSGVRTTVALVVGVVPPTELHLNPAGVVGLTWPSLHDPGQPTLVLFGDRCPAGALAAEPGAVTRLDGPVGACLVRRELAALGVCVAGVATPSAPVAAAPARLAEPDPDPEPDPAPDPLMDPRR